jgi:branched-chain amino acid transport system permease protein
VLVQLLVTGLALGSMYGLVALGYHITWATSRTMNFSQGHAVMVGAVIAWALVVALGWPLPIGLLATLLALAVFGALIERVAVRPFFRASSPAWLLSTIACGIIAENVAQLLFGWGRMQQGALADVAQWGRIRGWSLLPQALVAIALAALAAQQRLRVAVLVHGGALLVLLLAAPRQGAVLMVWLDCLWAAIALVLRP